MKNIEKRCLWRSIPGANTPPSPLKFNPQQMHRFIDEFWQECTMSGKLRGAKKIGGSDSCKYSSLPPAFVLAAEWWTYSGLIFKEILRNRISLFLGGPEVLSMASFCSKREQMGLTWALLSVPITCVPTSETNKCMTVSFLQFVACVRYVGENNTK